MTNLGVRYTGKFRLKLVTNNNLKAIKNSKLETKLQKTASDTDFNPGVFVTNSHQKYT